MSSRKQQASTGRSLTFNGVRRVDDISHRFEMAWLAGEQSLTEDRLSDIDQCEAMPLFEEALDLLKEWASDSSWLSRSRNGGKRGRR